MSTSSTHGPVVRFGVFEVDLRSGELRKSGLKIRLQQQPLQVLQILLEHRGEVVSRSDLRARLWGDSVFVDFDRSLNRAIVKLREALGDVAESPRYIETLPRVGYRFIAPVEDAGAGASVAPGSRLGDSAESRGTPTVAGVGASRRRRLYLTAAPSLALLVLGGALLYRHWNSSQTAAEPGIHSIAVLPLANLSADSAQEYFADGITDELISDLAQISALKVISRTSVMRYKNTKTSLPAIGRELNVDAIVEGSVERSGGKVRVSAQLIRASSDTHLWAKTYERNLGDVIALQDEVAGAIAGEIRVRLLPAERVRLSTTQTVKPEAYEAYLQGLYHLYKRDQAELEKSTGYFQRAVDLQPDYALAYVGLGDSYALRSSFVFAGLPPQVAMPKSKAAAIRALEIDNTLGEAYTTLAYVETVYDWNWSKSEEDFKRALALKPNYAQAHMWYAMQLAALGRHDESIAEVKHAQELDPLSLITNTDVGLLLYLGGRGDEAEEQFRNVLQLNSDFYVAHWQLGLVYEQQRRFKEARAEFQKAQALSPQNFTILESLGEIEALSGRREEARKILRELNAASEKEFVSPYNFALLYTALGDKDSAFASLDHAYEKRDSYLIFLNVDPPFQTIRSDARFRNLLHRMGLGEH